MAGVALVCSTAYTGRQIKQVSCARTVPSNGNGCGGW
jgi:hypothetical protein